MKATIDFAGNVSLGGLSYKFENFTLREIEKHLSLYIVQGLNPAPWITMKAYCQSQEPVQGNDLISLLIGKNFKQRHEHFRRYFTVQHSYLPVPSQKTHPNWKVDHFLHHLNIVFIHAVVLSENISDDKQTI